MSVAHSLLKRVVTIEEKEAPKVMLMFIYSFLAMTSYTMLKPATRSTFISSLGSDNLPYVMMVSGFVIAFIMGGYTRVVSALPKKAIIPSTQIGMAALTVTFYLLFQTGAWWVSVGFFIYGLILGILLISQFWTLANDIFDARQAKRVFGFIGAGSSLGGIAGSSVAQQAKIIGTFNLLLISAAIMLLCMVIVTTILRRQPAEKLSVATGEEKGVGAGEALKLLRSSKHLQIIAAVIMFAAIGAGLIEQQLNMAAEASQGRNADTLTSFLGLVQSYTSILGFIIQIFLVSYIQRYLGVGFALMILPFSLGMTGIIMLLNAALWAPAMARVLDTSLRYTVDKTTREILFLPLPADIKYKAKPFVDVTVDRMGKATSALLALILIKPWGLNFSWQQISYASLVITALWVFTALRAKKGYVAAFRRSIEQHDVSAADVKIQSADLSTIETLIEELADPNEQRVLYAIDLLESLEKRNLVTPLLLYHGSDKVRARALEVIGALPADTVSRWQPHVERLLNDPQPEVRLAAMATLATMREQPAANLIKPFLDSPDSRLSSTAAVVLARSGRNEDLARVDATLSRLSADTSENGSAARRDVAVAVRQINHPQVHHLLIPLLYDSDPKVAEEAVRSVRQVGRADFTFVPTLISLLRDRRLKGVARDVLVSYGEEVVAPLAYFLRDPDEDLWVRRHIPATLAHIPSQASMDALAAALATETDGFLRFKLISAMDTLQRERPDLTFDRKAVEKHALREARRVFLYLSLHHNLFTREKLPQTLVLNRALKDNIARAKNRLWLLLGLVFPWKDIGAARWAIERGDAKAKASGLEYLDNLMDSSMRKRVLPVFEEMAPEERVRKANVILSTRPRGVEETLVELMNDDDQVIAACAIQTIAEQKVWALADDLEHVLAHRDARDFYVFEAASWALAAHRMPVEKRRALWLEPMPAVELVSRLTRLPLFAETSIDELFRVAGAGQQVRHEVGKTLYGEGKVPDGLQVLLDGSVDVSSSGKAAQTLDAPALLAFDETLQLRPMATTIRARDLTVCLVVNLETGRTLLANGPELVQGLFSTIVGHDAYKDRLLVVKGTADPRLKQLAADGIKPVEKALVLEHLEIFSRVSADDMLELANAATGVSFTEAAPLFTPSDRPAFFVLLDGELSLEADGEEARTAGEGDAVGLFETLAGRSTGRTARVVKPGSALRISHEALFDVLGQRPELTRGLMGLLLNRGAADAGREPAVTATGAR